VPWQDLFSEESLTVTDASPTVRQRELGLRLRKIRTGLGLTVEDVARKLMCSPAKVSRMETGARRPILRDIRELCSMYSLDEKVSDELMQLARQARESAWWNRYDEIEQVPYIGLEQDASSITAYSLYYIPGLLQTEDYARELVRIIQPKIEPDILEQRVQARVRRQQRLAGDNPPRYSALIDEAAFARTMGSNSLMVAQVDKLLSLAEDGQAVVQLVPFDRGAYPAADIMFVLLEFSELPPIVFVEGLAELQHLDRPDQVERYRESTERIRDFALSPKDSLQRLAEIRKGYDARSGKHAGLL
jgi:transcriptional regulator with XRE-family HTH domain